MTTRGPKPRCGKKGRRDRTADCWRSGYYRPGHHGSRVVPCSTVCSTERTASITAAACADAPAAGYPRPGLRGSHSGTFGPPRHRYPLRPPPTVASPPIGGTDRGLLFRGYRARYCYRYILRSTIVYMKTMIDLNDEALEVAAKELGN